MDAKKSVTISCSLWDFKEENGNHPRTITPPSNVVEVTRVPQSLFDSWWLLWEFDSTESRDHFLKNMPKELELAHAKGDFEQDHYDHWVEP